MKWHSDPISFSQKPVLINGGVYVSAVEIFTKLGANVTVDQQEKMMTITKEGKEIRLWETGRVTVDGKYVPITVQTRVIGGKQMIPIRFAADLLETSVEWDAQTRIATIADIGGKDKL
ncbi:copper amine oxidase N-terminal domain-containing protein [Brevibacillus sp. NRS-1366]|uniref:copper amine oxidase N-terminal domain-containing protein n=1 Tax=Brevibacillus sp. NRS-1366 TaxID=3233899 RepID=UPI003D1B5DB9